MAKAGKLKNIWNNDFYKTPPLPKWSFAISFENLFVNDKSYAPILNKAIVSAQWGKREISIVKTYYAGVEANFPGRVQNTGELNIVFNENNEMKISKILDELFNGECSNDRYFTGQTNKYIFNNTFTKNGRNIKLKIIKPAVDMSADNGEVVGEVTFHNCILTSINEEEVSYENTEDVWQRTARFSYDFMIDDRRTKY